MKYLIALIAAIAVATATDAAFAQCYGGACYGGNCYSGTCYGRSYYAGNCYGGSYYGGYTYAPTSTRYGFYQAYNGGHAAARSCYGGSCFNGSSKSSCSRGTVAGRVPGEYKPELATGAGSCANGFCGFTSYRPSADAAIQASDQFDAACKCGKCACDPCQCEETTETCAPCKAVETCETVETEETTEPVKPCGPCATQTTSACATGACPIRGAIKALASYLDAANQVRARYGLRALALDPTLDAQCENHAASMSRYGGLFHSGGAAEICAQNNSAGIQQALGQWLNSPGHRAILLSGAYSRAGVAAYRDAYGRNWCVMRFR